MAPLEPLLELVAGLFPRSYNGWGWSWTLTPSRAELNYERIYTSASPRAFMTCTQTAILFYCNQAMAIPQCFHTSENFRTVRLYLQTNIARHSDKICYVLIILFLFLQSKSMLQTNGAEGSFFLHGGALSLYVKWPRILLITAEQDSNIVFFSNP